MPITDFTYDSYVELLGIISRSGYNFASYHNWQPCDRPCIIRHDIDFELEKAVYFARIEAKKKIQSTYFILLNTDFYNVFSKKNINIIRDIQKMGHEIGLHFDETRYILPSDASPLNLVQIIQKEIKILESIIESSVTTVSMHRPSKSILESNISIPGIINSYDKIYLEEFKYLSDSRHSWREDAEVIIASQKYDRLHILTHPFWYTDEKEMCRDKLLKFIAVGRQERYINLFDNFQRLDEYIVQEDIQ